jgi:hypothetical protein
MTQAATLAQLASSGALSADSSGNVGIGTSSPSYNLHVKNASGNSYIASQYGTATIGLITAAANQVDIKAFNGTNDVITFTTGATERMRIDSTGGVRIKTTTNIFNSPINEALTVDNGTNGNAATFNTNAAGGFPVVYMRHQLAGSQNQIVFVSSSGTAGSITSNGLAVAYNTSSDYRLKENVQPMVGALDKVIQLKPCIYNWKHDGSDGQGFIAHELQAVVPDCVNGEKDAVDADGNPNYQGVDTSYLVATLTAAIQELKAELDVCKAEIAALKGV